MPDKGDTKTQFEKDVIREICSKLEQRKHKGVLPGTKYFGTQKDAVWRRIFAESAKVKGLAWDGISKESTKRFTAFLNNILTF